MYYKVPGAVLILLFLCPFLLTTGNIGPPAVGIRKMENQIIIDIFHPLTNISGREPVPIYDENNCHIFIYTVNLRINGSEVGVCFLCAVLSYFSVASLSCLYT